MNTQNYKTEPLALDEIDRKIIAALQKDGRKPFSVLAEELGVPASSVRYRLQRMQDTGQFQIVGIANPLNIGFERLAMLGIKCEAGKAPEICEEISKFAETSYVVLASGTFDAMVEVVCRDIEHFTDFLFNRLQKVPGVVGTETFFVLKAYKLSYGWGVADQHD
ncbi:Lrp/AsnC family transcriptional regulator [Leucobacter sp. OH2974_COT-288]|uniref:Lrp/AsnC family transcriptional regulator for asnA, asnC and gidA n=1 Tax=Canibacter oris TaxID=1365628 RepID=A0A840DNF9_9MICO|nr:Lrp/AsnC family transcriptional regulator [Canibacter oris]MBB4071079.1 Lrp/AsnC family transcriptional regulator for asnA, asnC and gidA [Canibacter oris]RRD34986.1 Lrp/AsnC family transcriptional regulator [Leucobacter sp. OH2974_COT-288]